MAPEQSSLTPAEHAADQALLNVSERFKLVSALAPINLRDERKAFLNGDVENPHFTYDIDVEQLDTLHAALTHIESPRTVVGRLIEDKRLELIDKVDLLRSVGTPDFTEFSKKIYGVPDAETLHEAREALKRRPDVGTEPADENRLSAQSVVEAIEDVLKQYKLTDWTVELVERTVAGVLVNPQTRRIGVAAHTSLELSRLAPLITHEIETHVLTAENGREQPLSLFVQGFAGYLQTQEGLAAYNVSSQYPQQGRALRFWARNALAADLALRHSFKEVFEQIRALGFTEQFAFGVSAKVKRGLTDTSLPGGWTKDYVYLSGRRKVAAFIAAGGNLSELYTGKVSLDVVPTLRTLPWIKPPKLLPHFLARKA